MKPDPQDVFPASMGTSPIGPVHWVGYANISEFIRRVEDAAFYLIDQGSLPDVMLYTSARDGRGFVTLTSAIGFEIAYCRMMFPLGATDRQARESLDARLSLGQAIRERVANCPTIRGVWSGFITPPAGLELVWGEPGPEFPRAADGSYSYAPRPPERTPEPPTEAQVSRAVELLAGLGVKVPRPIAACWAPDRLRAALEWAQAAGSTLDDAGPPPDFLAPYVSPDDELESPTPDMDPIPAQERPGEPAPPRPFQSYGGIRPAEGYGASSDSDFDAD
jgi:hypothetical protein